MPATSVFVVPGDAAPAKDSVPAEPLMCIVKSDAVAVLPFLLTTVLITVSFGATSSLTSVHV